MKAKSRRRLLISSVAMLLVAMLALGTATFAWFTNTTTATAENAKVTVAAPSGLVISAVAKGASAPAANTYKSKFDLTSLAQGTLTPVSGYAQASADPTFFAASVDTEKNVSKVVSDTDNVIAVDIYGKLSATSEDKDVQLTSVSFTGSTPGNVVRGAFYKADSSRVAYLDFGTAQGRSVYPVKQAAATVTGVTADANYVIPNSAAFVDNTALTTAAVTATGLGKVKYSTGTKIGTLYLWVEGQDEQCNNAEIDNVVGATGDITLTFDLVES